MYYLRIDVDKRESSIAVLDEDGDVVEVVRSKTRNSTISLNNAMGQKQRLKQLASIIRSTTLLATILMSWLLIRTRLKQ